ncbi:MAG: hypothetical protein IKJ27_11675 [Clostridia bacterium]|nr:hypothetical protein [Clostridia bacterium]
MNINDESLERCFDAEAFRSWQSKAREAEREEMLLRRKEELQRLVRKVIREELDEFDRRLVELHWYKGLSKSTVAEMLSVDRTTVHRHFTKINETVYEKLKYAVELIYGGNSEKEIKAITENSKTLSSHINADEISTRLKSLRARECLTVEHLSIKTDISQLRLKQIEKRGSVMTMAELKKLTAFYRVSCNYIIFGTD